MIVLDANVLIGFLDSRDPHHHASVALLERHVVEGFASSVLTVAEALVHPTRADREDAALSALHRIGVRILTVEPSDAADLARVRSTYRVRMPDAVALHAALKFSAGLATFDDALATAAEQAGISVAR
ncbi:MAG: type II toxin-antitoxin system VapC family toxin [Rhodoglobus sp.]